MGSMRRLERRRRKNTVMLPPELAHKISPWTVNGAEMAGAVGKAAFIVVAVICLYGSGAGIAKSDHNGYMYLLGPWVFPFLIASLWSARLAKLPFRVYRGNPFGAHTYVDTGEDPAVARLAALLKSDEARQHLWRESFKVSLILFAILGTEAIYYRHSLNWTLPLPQNHFLANRRIGEPGAWFWLSVIGCSWAMFMILISDYYRWCLTTWAKRETAYDVNAHHQARA